jgi:hypothetical protein
MLSTRILRTGPSRRGAACLAPLVLALWFSGWPGATPASAADETLDQALSRRAVPVLRFLRDKHYHNVGVLKFRVQKGDEDPTDNAGPLNLDIANRLEAALVLANPDEGLGIIQGASATLVSAHNGRANHVTADGRRACFDTSFHLPYGNKGPVLADAFVTGLVHLSADRRHTEVTLCVSDKGGLWGKLGKPFTVATDARTLVEAGESFRLPDAVFRKGAFDDNEKESKLQVAVTTAAANVTTGQQTAPVPDGSALVELRILYNSQPAPYTVKNGQVSVPEPTPDQRVTFALRNNTKETCGAVLMVNGENTVYRQKGDPFRCTKWVLEPGKEYLIPGYQLDTKQLAPFEVSSPEESAKDEVNYKEHAGTFTLTVFRRQAAPPGDLPQDSGPGGDGPPATTAASGKATAVDPAKSKGRGTAEADATELQIVSKGIGTLPTRPGSLQALKEQLRSRGKKGLQDDTVSKGLVRPGQEHQAAPVDVVDFEASPTPASAVTIRYYQPKGQ